jgi:osmotically-inducible protein OsmY
MRCSVLLAAIAATACRADTATQDAPVSPPSLSADLRAHDHTSDASLIPENPSDRRVRRDLGLAIAGDPELKDRDISFIVSRGDVSVSGVVRSEDERRKINDLAMGIDGVRSVANALRVAE